MLIIGDKCRLSTAHMDSICLWCYCVGLCEEPITMSMWLREELVPLTMWWYHRDDFTSKLIVEEMFHSRLSYSGENGGASRAPFFMIKSAEAIISANQGIIWLSQKPSRYLPIWACKWRQYYLFFSMWSQEESLIWTCSNDGQKWSCITAKSSGPRPKQE